MFNAIVGAMFYFAWPPAAVRARYGLLEGSVSYLSALCGGFFVIAKEPQMALHSYV